MRMAEELHEYYFQGIRWIPSYGDFDQDDVTVKAKDIPSAWEEFDKLKMKNWKSVGITHVDGEKLKEDVLK
jgi:hypothetical protein